MNVGVSWRTLENVLLVEVDSIWRTVFFWWKMLMFVKLLWCFGTIFKNKHILLIQKRLRKLIDVNIAVSWKMEVVFGECKDTLMFVEECWCWLENTRVC